MQSQTTGRVRCRNLPLFRLPLQYFDKTREIEVDLLLISLFIPFLKLAMRVVMFEMMLSVKSSLLAIWNCCTCSLLPFREKI
jgi:hypothetical protein